MELKELLDHIKVGDSTLVHISCNITDTYSVISLIFEKKIKEEKEEVNLNIHEFMQRSGNYKEVM